MSEELNSEDWHEDNNARTLSYFSARKTLVVDKLLVERLKKIARERGGVNARLCLHISPEETLHDMVIIEYKDKKCRKPHKHLEKDESLQMIEGIMAAITFDNEGRLIEKIMLDSENNFMCRNSRENYHVWIPVTDYVIYRETKQGPFKQGENIPPEWDYAKRLEECLPEIDIGCKNLGCKKPCSLNLINKRNGRL